VTAPAPAPGMPALHGMLTAEMSGRAASPVLVGREEQMAALDAAFDSVRQGAPTAVLLGGEAGVGKSRLVSEFGRAATAAGARVLTGGCLELGTDGLPFAPFTAVLRDLVHELGAEAVASMLPGRTTRGLARLLPELGEPETGGDPGEARARLFEEVLSALDHLARHSPVVLVIEDAHWADRSSRDLLTFLIGNQRAISGLLIVVTFRSDELHRTHPLRPMLALLDRISWVERIELPRLTSDGTAALAAGILGRALAADLADALYRRTEGNPLFVETLAGCDGELTCELPESLRDLLLDGMRRLPEQTQEVLRVASAGSETIGHALLAAVTGLDDAALTGALRPAVTANVLRAWPSGYTFRHELIREAVHEDLLPGEHGRLHSRFAEAIDADPALVPPGRAAIEMAHHWHAAHDSVWALIGAWRAAAAQAGRTVAPAERLALLARVLELWDQVPDAAERIGADHARVLEEATCAAQDAGEFERGIALASSALRELDAAAAPVRVAQLLEARGHFKKQLGRKEFSDDFSAALLIAPADTPAVRIPILLAAARCVPVVAMERSYAEEALVLARQSRDEANEADALMALAMFRAGAGEQAGTGSDPLELLAQARAMAVRAGRHRLVAKAAINESHLLAGAGEHELAVAAARRGLPAEGEPYLDRTSQILLAINQAEPLYNLGRWDEALAVTQAREFQFTSLPLHRSMLAVLVGLIALGRGDTEAATAAAAAAGELLRGTPQDDEYRLPFGRLEILLRLATAGPAAALATAAEVIDGFELSGGSPRYAWPMVAAAAQVCAAAGRDAPASLAGRLRTIAEKLEVFGPAQQAARLTFVATDAQLSGEPGLLAAWDAAAAAWAAVSEPYPQAQALWHAAEAALSSGERDGAAERLRSAAALAPGLGAGALAGQIEQLARRARIVLDPAVPAAPEAGSGLTGRELEVLRLVAAGRSNRDIANQLFISPKTASVHVSNILGKLGVATRGEAAAQAHARRLVDPL
jgi:ATP/maltotriose-dependent transcriptional regulator MalT